MGRDIGSDQLVLRACSHGQIPGAFFLTRWTMINILLQQGSYRFETPGTSGMPSNCLTLLWLELVRSKYVQFGPRGILEGCAADPTPQKGNRLK